MYPGVGCGKELGMNDGGINDFQVSASTETEDHPAAHSRPGLSGWCADPADSSPYLQVRPLDMCSRAVKEFLVIIDFGYFSRIHFRFYNLGAWSM